MNSLIRVGACDACGVKEWSYTALASVNQRVAVARKTVDLPTSKGKSYPDGWRGMGRPATFSNYELARIV